MSHTACPNSTASGCRCPQHDPGLSVYARDPAAYEAALAPLRPTTLHVVTLPAELPCDGTMTCRCQRCAIARTTPASRGSLAGHQPWTPRPSRRAA